MIRYECPQCEATLESEGSMSGATGKCPECGATVPVPLSNAQKAALQARGITLDDEQSEAKAKAQRQPLQEEKRRRKQLLSTSFLASIFGLVILGGLLTAVLVYVLGEALFRGHPWHSGAQGSGFLLFLCSISVAPFVGAVYWVAVALYIRLRCASGPRRALSWTLAVVGYMALVCALIMAVLYVTRPTRS